MENFLESWRVVLLQFAPKISNQNVVEMSSKHLFNSLVLPVPILLAFHVEQSGKICMASLAECHLKTFYSAR